MAEGWKGANTAECALLKNYCFCKVCMATEDIRMFHSLERGNDEHIVMCKKHAKELSNNWYGCGCGG